MEQLFRTIVACAAALVVAELGGCGDSTSDRPQDAGVLEIPSSGGERDAAAAAAQPDAETIDEGDAGADLVDASDPAQPDAAPMDAGGEEKDAQVGDGGDGDAASVNDAAADAATAADASARCSHPLQCQPGYPAVPYPAENPHNDEKALLGKILFWEEQIGELDTMACGTCHRAGSGGSDPRAASPIAHRPGPDGVLDSAPGLDSDDVHGSLGTPKCASDGRIVDATIQATGRKAPSYLDAMFGLEIFWDGRAGYCKHGEATGGCFYDPDLPDGSAARIIGQLDPLAKRRVGGALEAQASGPPASSVEMACEGQSWRDIALKLRSAVPLAKASAVPPAMSAFIAAHDHSYPKLFAAVYGDALKLDAAADGNDTINARRIVYAIATHERRLTSHQTPWDAWNAGDDAAMTPTQIHGFELFMGKGRCGTCHAPPLFTDLSFHYVGFHKPSTDAGRSSITGSLEDLGKVKTPTVRNVGLREAGGLLRSGEGAGHDLVSMMRAYKQGGLRTDSEVVKFIDPALEVLDLTGEEVDAMVDFMRNALTDPRVRAESAPFDRPKLGSEAP